MGFVDDNLKLFAGGVTFVDTQCLRNETALVVQGYITTYVPTKEFAEGLLISLRLVV